MLVTICQAARWRRRRAPLAKLAMGERVGVGRALETRHSLAGPSAAARLRSAVRFARCSRMSALSSNRALLLFPNSIALS